MEVGQKNRLDVSLVVLMALMLVAWVTVVPAHEVFAKKDDPKPPKDKPGKPEESKPHEEHGAKPAHDADEQDDDDQQEHPDKYKKPKSAKWVAKHCPKKNGKFNKHCPSLV